MPKEIYNAIGRNLKTLPMTGKRREIVAFLRANPGIAFSTRALLGELDGKGFYIYERDLSSAYRSGYTLRINSKYFEFNPTYFETDKDFFVLDKILKTKNPIKVSSDQINFYRLGFIYFSPKEEDIDEVFEKINSLRQSPLAMQIAVGEFFEKKYMVKDAVLELNEDCDRLLVSMGLKYLSEKKEQITYKRVKSISPEEHRKNLKDLRLNYTNPILEKYGKNTD